MFTNCLKLNKSGNNILVDSQQRIQHMVVALLRQFQQKIQHKDFNDPLLFNFVYLEVKFLTGLAIKVLAHQ